MRGEDEGDGENEGRGEGEGEGRARARARCEGDGEGEGEGEGDASEGGTLLGISAPVTCQGWAHRWSQEDTSRKAQVHHMSRAARLTIEVDPRLGSNGGVDIAHESGRHTDVWRSPAVDGRGEANDVHAHATSNGNHGVESAVDAVLVDGLRHGHGHAARDRVGYRGSTPRSAHSCAA